MEKLNSESGNLDTEYVRILRLSATSVKLNIYSGNHEHLFIAFPKSKKI